MATSGAPASKSVAGSDRTPNPVLGGLLCAAVVAAAMGSLWMGLMGLLKPDAAAGVPQALGGFAGFFVILGLTLVMAARQK